MAHPLEHAKNSARKFGGAAEDYLPIHEWFDESSLPADLDTQKLGDLLERFAPEGYEDGEGGHGTITFDVQTGKIRVEHNWYEIVSNPADPREI